MSTNITLWLGVAILLFCGLCLYKNKENFTRYTGIPYPNMCEFNEDCMWDTARWVQLSNGMEGVCTLHGIACPAFSKDHEYARTRGLSPDMVDEKWAQKIRMDNPFIGDEPNSMLSNVWGINPPLINHYQDGRFKASDIYYGSGLAPEVKVLPSIKKEDYSGDTAIGLGMYPTSGG